MLLISISWILNFDIFRKYFYEAILVSLWRVLQQLCKCFKVSDPCYCTPCLLCFTRKQLFVDVSQSSSRETRDGSRTLRLLSSASGRCSTLHSTLTRPSGKCLVRHTFCVTDRPTDRSDVSRLFWCVCGDVTTPWNKLRWSRNCVSQSCLDSIWNLSHFYESESIWT